MLNKFYQIFKFVIIVCYGWIIYIGFCEDRKKGRLEYKKYISKNLDKIIRESFIRNLNVVGQIPQTEDNKIDILISNHNSTIDFILLVMLLQNFNISKYYFIFKKSIIKIPFIGSGLKDDIVVSRNWEQDQNSIVDQLKEIDSGVLIIYPEGTRFDTKKHKETKKFCLENKFPIFKYTLAPRIKGLHLLLKSLHVSKKLGNFYDVTISFLNYIKTNLYSTKILKEDCLGDVQIVVNQLQVTNDDFDYDKLKKRIFNIWLEKNILLDKLYRNQIRKS